jgi:hypothetical protein
MNFYFEPFWLFLFLFLSNSYRISNTISLFFTAVSKYHKLGLFLNSRNLFPIFLEVRKSKFKVPVYQVSDKRPFLAHLCLLAMLPCIGSNKEAFWDLPYKALIPFIRVLPS